MAETVLQWVSTYGYVAIFALLMSGIIALPVPEETLLVFSGYLIYTGRLNAAGVFTAALLGSLCGITVSYWIGRKFGVSFLHHRLAKTHDWFHRAGHWTLFFGYYIAGVRHFTAVVAGASELEYRHFAAYAYSGALGWVSLFLFIGYHFGERWQVIVKLVERHIRTASAIAALAVVIYVIVWWLRRKREVR